jgi:two-component system nitrate/nitrite response regulator NarL
VLIVDDDQAFRSLAARMVSASGLTVAGEAGDAREAIAVAAELMPDAVLVDFRLPDRDGIDLGHDLAALPWAPRVLLISGDPDVADLDRRAPGGGELPFVAKEDLPRAPLDRLLGGHPN